MKAQKSAMKQLGDIVKYAVKSGSCTTAEIVLKTGISRSFVYAVMAGEAEDCTVSTLQALCAAVGAEPADVFRAPKAAPADVVDAAEKVLRYVKGGK